MEQGVVRKIVVGKDPKSGMAYYIGMRAGENKVSAIILDEDYLFSYQKTRYLVYVENEKETMLWKALESMPCMLEFDLNF